VPEIHRTLIGRGLEVSERTVTNLLDRYDELLAVALTGDRRLKGRLAGQGRVILAIDGLQPAVGHEVLWVVRDCLSGEVLLAKSLLSARQQDLAELLVAVRDAAGRPAEAVPDRFAAAVFAQRAFDLVRRGRDAPDEAGGKGHSGLARPPEEA